MSKILIVDPSEYNLELKALYLAEGFEIEQCDTAFDAIAKLASDDFQLVVTDVDLPGDNSFEFYYYLKKNMPFMPVIMLTEKRIETIFDKIFTEGIGNVLHKPAPSDEIIGLTRKLIRTDKIFGLENFIPGIKILKKISINSSSMILPAINKIIEQITEWNFTVKNSPMVNLILNEMIINAVYHAHGLTEQKLKRIPVKLEDGKKVDIHFGHNGEKYGISITDYNGKLSKKRILESMYNVVEQKKLIEEAFEKGQDISQLISETGRGLDLVRQIAREYFFVIEKGVKTEVTIIFDGLSSDDESSTASLKIIERE